MKCKCKKIMKEKENLKIHYIKHQSLRSFDAIFCVGSYEKVSIHKMSNSSYDYWS